MTPLQTQVGGDKQYHVTLRDAARDGWLDVYYGSGGNNRESRVYGRKPGNHRIWRCYKPQCGICGSRIKLNATDCKNCLGTDFES